MEPRLFASCKDALFAAVMDYYGQSDFREDVQLSNDLFILYRAFKDIADYIMRRAPRVSLTPLESTPSGSDHADQSDYQKTYSEHIDIEDDKLQFLTRTVIESYFLHDNSTRTTATPDFTRLLLIDPERLIRKKLYDKDEKIFGFALYITPPECHRLVFFGAGNAVQSQQFRKKAAAADFNWLDYSKSYARWRFMQS